jgi:hypothetical protein
MENFKLEKDINLFCVKADAFPQGIMAAHQKLVSIGKRLGKRNYFGVSYMYDDEILYMAAAELNHDKETIPASCETYTLRKGNYISIYISDFANNTSQIEKAFKALLADPKIDENGCCAECYFPEGSDGTNAKDVRCMVRLAD